MAITFDYAVKYHGKYYNPGEPIEEVVKPEEPAEPAEPAKNGTEAAQGGETAEGEAKPDDEQEAPKKAAKGRKKGDA